jgi:putative transposase
MSRQLRIEFPGAIHHLTSRGNERRNIDRDDRDRRRFPEILEEVVIFRLSRFG